MNEVSYFKEFKSLKDWLSSKSFEEIMKDVEVGSTDIVNLLINKKGIKGIMFEKDLIAFSCEMKCKYKEGSRIRLNHMGDDIHPIKDGSLGTVDFVDDIGTVFVNFDNGRNLGLIYGEDDFEIVS